MSVYIGVWAAAPSGASVTNTVTANGSTSNPFSGSASTIIGSASDFRANSPMYGTDLFFSMTITRLDATQISVAAELADNADHLVQWSPEAAPAAPASPASFTFDSVGILLGGTTDATVATFSNVEVAVVPEPASALLGLLGSLAQLRRRR